MSDEQIKYLLLGYAISAAEHEMDACSPLDAGIIEQGVKWLQMYLEHKDAEHFGDCIREANTCLRCLSDVVHEMAQKAIDITSEKPAVEVPTTEDDRLVTVCANCLQASCWQGQLMCAEAHDADAIALPISALKKLNREHSDYWKTGRS